MKIIKSRSLKHHTVEINELFNWQQSEKILFANSTREDKCLYCTLRGSYEVWHKKQKVLETLQPYVAVEKYNSITDLT